MELDGEWVDEPRQVKEAVATHFRNHFRENRTLKLEMPKELVELRLGEGERESLISSFTEEEVRNVVWECDDSKSPGPDGFNMGFFKACWDTVKGDIMRMMLEFHENGKLVRGLNASYIVLIPKKEGSCGIHQMRPISLIGGIYKILSKVLAARMKVVVGKIIGEVQTAFIKGRHILDGVVVLNEAIEEAKKTKGRRFIFKVDFEKAYDSINWAYLLEMLEHLNFPFKWIR